MKEPTKNRGNLQKEKKGLRKDKDFIFQVFSGATARVFLSLSCSQLFFLFKGLCIYIYTLEQRSWPASRLCRIQRLPRPGPKVGLAQEEGGLPGKLTSLDREECATVADRETVQTQVRKWQESTRRSTVPRSSVLG